MEWRFDLSADIIPVDGVTKLSGDIPLWRMTELIGGSLPEDEIELFSDFLSGDVEIEFLGDVPSGDVEIELLDDFRPGDIEFELLVNFLSGVNFGLVCDCSSGDIDVGIPELSTGHVSIDSSGDLEEDDDGISGDWFLSEFRVSLSGEDVNIERTCVCLSGDDIDTVLIEDDPFRGDSNISRAVDFLVGDLDLEDSIPNADNG